MFSSEPGVFFWEVLLFVSSLVLVALGLVVVVFFGGFVVLMFCCCFLLFLSLLLLSLSCSCCCCFPCCCCFCCCYCFGFCCCGGSPNACFCFGCFGFVFASLCLFGLKAPPKRHFPCNFRGFCPFALPKPLSSKSFFADGRSCSSCLAWLPWLKNKRSLRHSPS